MKNKNIKGLIALGLLIFFIIGVHSVYKTKLVSSNDQKKVDNKSNVKSDKKNQTNIKKVLRVKDREFTGNNLKYNSESIPILYYHSIDYEKGNELRVPKEKFREQMKYLKDNGYTTLTLNELYNFLAYNKPVPNKSVVITLDDGYKDNYENAFPILKEFGFKATVFMITSSVNNEKDFLTSSELKQMDSYGMDIESHTVNHDKLDRLTYDKQIQTLKDSKEFLEKLLNKKIKYIAYPYGKWNESAIKALKTEGYSMAFTTAGGWTNKDQGIYTLHRVYVSEKYGMNEFKRRLTNGNYESTNK
ncbi:polysaccharide deacetylase family protein [Clostridium sp. AWRP]|uniref:polysaccharide deacetylase family protein n=1 Tax=Clostridium sp. AWRP TaxID=2212991 RepID=UPI000FDC92D0|nr:polysaccharide deacetylase family protein [Clostridium sp. AWRP]AZV55240.1 polysaccharide deacetylase family protein [Clostridium sp. AWRP]